MSNKQGRAQLRKARENEQLRITTIMAVSDKGMVTSFDLTKVVLVDKASGKPIIGELETKKIFE